MKKISLKNILKKTFKNKKNINIKKNKKKLKKNSKKIKKKILKSNKTNKTKIKKKENLSTVETKNYKGWIFGSESQSTWTQVIYGSKNSFQNPLRQTYRHKRVLSEYLGIRESQIQPVIFFAGDAQFKTELPSNVLRSGLGSYIKQFRERVLYDREVERISDLLSIVISEIGISKDEHLKSLHERFASDTVCPKCGSNLVMRTVKKTKFNAISVLIFNLVDTK